MTKEITVADLKEHLEERLEEVRNGTTLRVVEPDHTVVQLAPELDFINRADRSQKLGDFRLPPLEPPVKSDGVEVLLELRDIDRRR